MAVEEVGVRLVAEDAARFEKATRDARKALLEFVMATQDGSRDVEQASNRAGQSVVAFVDESGRAYGRLDAFAEIAIGALRRVGEIAVNAMLEAGRATAQFMQDSVSAAGNFEATLNRFSAVTGDSLASAGMDVEDFSDLFLEMGAKTQYSAQQAGEAAVNLAKGGIDPATIAAGGLEAALALAAAGELELATAAEITAKQLGVWASTGVDAATVANLMAQAANASTVDVENLALGMAQVGGVAKLTGLSLDETVQTMALLSPGFGSASDAGTSFKMFLSNLIPTTEKAKNAMKDLGLATSDNQSLFFDAQGNFIGMEQAAGLLASATADLSEEERQLALETIFGQDAIRAASLIAEQGAAGFNAMGESMNAAGTAAEQAEERNRGYNFALEEMRGSLETLQIVIGTELLPILTDLIQNHITPGINSFMEFSKAVFESEDPMATLVQKIDELIPGFSDFVAGVTEVINTLVNLPARISEISTTLQEEFAPEIQLAQAVFETAMIVIGKVVDAVVGTVMEAFNELTSELTTDSTTWTNLVKSFEAYWTALQPHIAGILATIGALFLIFIGVVVGVFTGIMNAIDPFLQGLSYVLTFMTIVLEGIEEVVRGFVDLVVSLFQGNATGVLEALQRMEDGVKIIILGLLGTALSLFGTLVATVLAFIGGLYEGVKGFFQKLYDDLVGSSIVVDLVNDILGLFEDLYNDGKQWFLDLMEDIKTAFDFDWFGLGKGIIDGIIEGIASAVTNLTTAVQNAASSAYNAAKDYLLAESPSKLFMEIGEWTMQGLAIGIDDNATLPTIAMDDALMSMMSGSVSQLASAPVTNNTYNTTNVYEGAQFGVNVRTQESAGTVGNTIKALQSINRVQRG